MLIVDDNADAANSLGMILESQGHRIEYAYSGREALERAVRLVALTGYGQAEDRQRAQAAGFDAHLIKPADMSALQRVLADLPES